MIPSLYLKELKGSLPATLVIVCVLAMYTAMIVSMFDPELGASLEMMRESMPELFAAFGMAEQGTTLMDFVLNYLYGFLFVAFPLVLVLLLVNRLVVRHMETGTLSCLLATPHARLSIVLTQALALVTALVATLACMHVLELACAETMFPGELDAGELLAVNAGLLALWLFFAGLCFLSAVSFNRTGAALWVGGGICIASILVQMVSQVGDAFESLGRATPLALFDAGGIAASSGDAVAGACALAGCGIACLALAAAVFCRRDFNV